jgi:hypothetical protein
MTTETPLTCYLCGRTSDEWMTVDMLGLFEDQRAASEHFEEKHGTEPESYLFVCLDCEDEKPHHARNGRLWWIDRVVERVDSPTVVPCPP